MKMTLMKTLMFKFLMLATLGFASAASAETVTFEGLLDQPGTFYNGLVGVRGWTVGDVTFDNQLTVSDFGSFWNGWSYSNVVDTTTPGFLNQYASATGGGSDGLGGVDVGGTYAVAFGSNAFFDFATPTIVQSADVANTTFASLSLRTGDQFAKRFGGESGNDPDFFRATLTGFDDVGRGGSPTGSVTIDLADFTSDDNSLDFILDQWLNVDLRSLGVVRSIGVTFASSDVGRFGINTPTYLALDNLQITAVPEPGSLALLASLAGVGLLVRRRRQNARLRRQKSPRQIGTGNLAD